MSERQRREEMWRLLLRAGGPLGVAPDVLRRLGIYGGAQGIWVDKARTAPLVESGSGVAVGLLHTGSSYADDLSDDGVIYHYPATRRPGGRDASEITAVKAAEELGLPVFVIAYPKRGAATRDVRLAWVAGHDDRSRQFLVLFGERPPAEVTAAEDEGAAFELVDQHWASRLARSRSRAGQQRFKFLVVRRYGPECAVCGIALPEVLETAHVRPKEHDGSDDPGAALFVGDSVLASLDVGALVDRGVQLSISGDTTRRVVSRINHYPLAIARLVVFHVGTNDLQFRRPSDLYRPFARMLKEVPADVPVVMSAVLPVDELATDRYGNAEIRAVNRVMAQACAARPGCTFADAAPAVTDAAGGLEPRYHTGDGVHLKRAGNRAWRAALAPVLAPWRDR